jgi:hypothetical protein
MVPRRHGQDKSLGQWVSHQRNSRINNKMRLDRKRILEDLGFVWSARDESCESLWNKQDEKLVEFKRKHGHCVVPCRYEQDKSLGEWVRNQRSCRNSKTIRLDRKNLLEDLGFAWNGRDESRESLWNEHYQELVEFKERNGHCVVPRRYEQDKALGQWVRNQRRFHSNNKMRPDRKKLLDEVDFAPKANSLAARSSTTDVRGLVIRSFCTLWAGHVFLTLVSFSAL